MRCSKVFRVFAIAVLILAFSLPGGIKVSAAEYSTGIYKINTKSDPLNVRAGFSTDHIKVGSIAKGTEVNVTLVADGWGKIVYGDIHGWISLEYCKYVGQPEESEVNPTKLSDEVYGISPKNLEWVTGWKQEYSRSSGLCTSCATASLLRRRQAAEGKEVTITFGDVRAALGGNPIPDSKGYYESCNSYFTDTTPFYHLENKNDENRETYYLHRDYEATHINNREYLADLLDVHPEGVVVYTTYPNNGKHGILISDYKRKSNGTLQFYAYDPANGTGRCRLEDTWIMTKIGSVNQYFKNVTCIWYVIGDLTVDDGFFDHPEAQAHDATLTVSKKTYTYTSTGKKAEKVEKLSKGDEIDVSYTYEDSKGNKWYITEDDLYVKAEYVKEK